MAVIEQLTISLNQLFGWSITISGIVALCICVLWSIWFNRIKEGQKAEFQKQIEKQKAEFCEQLELLKAKHEKTNYITKTQFDAEFKIYQELSEACYDMILDILDLFTNKPKLFEMKKNPEHNIKLHERSLKSNFYFQGLLSRYAAFMSKEMYELFHNLRINCKEQTDDYYEVYIQSQEQQLQISSLEENIKNTSNLFDTYVVILEKLREYLKSLKVIED